MILMALGLDGLEYSTIDEDINMKKFEELTIRRYLTAFLLLAIHSELRGDN